MAKRIFIFYNRETDTIEVFLKLKDLYNHYKDTLKVSLSTLQHFDFKNKSFERLNFTITMLNVFKTDKKKPQ